eukprot:COSAG05_NODE_709_length_7823_cov_2.423485_5_plen_119_part_00
MYVPLFLIGIYLGTGTKNARWIALRNFATTYSTSPTSSYGRYQVQEWIALAIVRVIGLRAHARAWLLLFVLAHTGCGDLSVSHTRAHSHTRSFAPTVASKTICFWPFSRSTRASLSPV